MPFSSVFAFYLLLCVVLIGLGYYYNPPDVVAYTILLTFSAVSLYILSEYTSLPSWYVAMIYRLRKAVLRF